MIDRKLIDIDRTPPEVVAAARKARHRHGSCPDMIAVLTDERAARHDSCTDIVLPLAKYAHNHLTDQLGRQGQQALQVPSPLKKPASSLDQRQVMGGVSRAPLKEGNLQGM